MEDQWQLVFLVSGQDWQQLAIKEVDRKATSIKEVTEKN